MVKLIIRDDDVSYFTCPNDLREVYAAEEFNGFPISFAAIPMVMDISTKAACPETKGNTVPQWIGKNNPLVDYLSNLASHGLADILLHGITHSYKVDDGKRLAEMQWRDEPDLEDKICEYRSRMSQLFAYPVSVFVAPSNKISRYGIRAIAANGMNYSGIIPITFDRDVSFRSVYNYVRRWWSRWFVGLPYPGVMDYGDHREMNACTLQGYDYLVKMYCYCEKHGYPMAVNVHYWHLRDHPSELQELIRFVAFAREQGAVPAKLSDVLK